MTDQQSSVTFRFHGELNYFLPRTQREQVISHQFSWRASVKDMIESIAPPHCEVEAVTVDGLGVDFDYIVADAVHIDVYDYYTAQSVTNRVRITPLLQGRPRFILDTHLGRLASYLRMLGFDTLYRNDYADDLLAEISHQENRILLTRDLGLLKRSLVIYGRFMRNTAPRLQLAEVVGRYGLAGEIEPFLHCIKCNGKLRAVSKEAVLEELTQRTARSYDEFHRCASCGQIYWKGSHYDRMREFVDEVIKNQEG